MKKTFVIIPLMLCMAMPATAEKIKYYQDPVFQQLNSEDPHPMSELLGLAEDGDMRAQFIIADLYAKGKGGLSKNEKKARHWFEACARQGYSPAFIRLAALAKRAKDPELAYQWYTLAIERSGFGKEQKWAVRARNKLAAEAEMTKEQINRARNNAALWKDGHAQDASVKTEAPAKPTAKDKQKSDDDKAEKKFPALQPKKERLFNE